MDKSNLTTVAVGALALVGGIALGTGAYKLVAKKAPELLPALLWVGGALTGGAAVYLTKEKLTTKSEAASILASGS